MTMQPAQGPGRMQNPYTALLEVMERQLALMERLVELAEANKRALDALQQPEPSPYSVAGISSGSPFIGDE